MSVDSPWCTGPCPKPEPQTCHWYHHSRTASPSPCMTDRSTCLLLCHLHLPGQDICKELLIRVKGFCQTDTGGSDWIGRQGSQEGCWVRVVHHSQVSPNLGEIVFQCPHVRMSFQLRLGAEPEVLVDPIHPSVVFHLRHPVQGAPTCPNSLRAGVVWCCS